MKTLIFFCLSMLFLAGCGSSGGSSSTTSTTACTYQNGAYYVNGVAYQSCPSGSTLSTGTTACTYTNGLYYYNGVGYATCPVASTGYGTTGAHNCANLTLMDMYGQVGVCTVNYNYCAGYTMMSTQGGGQIYCQ